MAERQDIKVELQEAVRPFRLLSIGTEFVKEVGRAREKHGPNTDLADGTGRHESAIFEANEHSDLADGWDYIPDNEDMATMFKVYNDERCADGRKHTRLGIVLEEVFEAAAENDSDLLRAELVQVGAMVLDWIADIDKRPRN